MNNVHYVRAGLCTYILVRVCVSLVYTPASAYECKTTGAASIMEEGVKARGSSTRRMLSEAGFTRQAKRERERERAQNWSVTCTQNSSMKLKQRTANLSAASLS